MVSGIGLDKIFTYCCFRLRPQSWSPNEFDRHDFPRKKVFHLEPVTWLGDLFTHAFDDNYTDSNTQQYTAEYARTLYTATHDQRTKHTKTQQKLLQSNDDTGG